MKTYNVNEADGTLPDDASEGVATTMTHDRSAVCSNGHTPLVRSSRRVYCNQCGVWWWWSRGEVNNHG